MQGQNVLIPSLVGVTGGMCAGLAYTLVRVLGQRGERGPFIVLFFSAFSCLITLPYLIFDFHPMTAAQFFTLLLAGLSGRRRPVYHHRSLHPCSRPRSFSLRLHTDRLRRRTRLPLFRPAPRYPQCHRLLHHLRCCDLDVPLQPSQGSPSAAIVDCLTSSGS